MNYVDVFFETADGLRLYARDYPGPRENSPVVLCLPGLTRNSKDFDALADGLCASYRVICPDQRGRGRSARDPQPNRYRPDVYVGDMVRLLDTLGVPQVAVIGTSLGGMMGILLTVSQPDRVRALIINDMGPVIDPIGIARIIGYVGKSSPVETGSEAVEQARVTNGVAFPAYTDSDWAAMTRNLYVQEGTRPVLDYDPAISQGFGAGTATPDLWPLFDAMPPLPLMVIRGELTDILSIETLAEMQRRRPQMQVVPVADVGHAPMLDEPAARSAIVDFWRANRDRNNVPRGRGLGCTKRMYKADVQSRCIKQMYKAADGFTICRMKTDDIAGLIAPLHAASWKTAYRGIMSDHFLDHVVDGERRAHWRKKVDALTAGDGEIFLARLNDEPVGFLCIQGAELEEANIHGAYVNNLHVLPHIKGQGIGTALLARGAEWARERGFSQMYLFVFEDNLDARKFYRANGWHVVERLMSELPGGELAAELRLVKPI